MIIIDELNKIGTIAADYVTPTMDVSVFDGLRSAIYGDQDGQILYSWSTNGIDFTYGEYIDFTANTGTVNSASVKAKYLRITYACAVYPASLKIQHLFLDAPLSLSALRNLGAGAYLYNSALGGIRSVVSDGSVHAISIGTEIELSASPNLIVGANSDVQVTHGFGDFSIGIAKGAQTGPNSLYITGTDTSSSVGVNDFCCCVGEGVGNTGLVDGASVVSGYKAAAGGCGVNCVLLGYKAGETNSGGLNKVAVGYQAGSIAQGTGSVSIGYQQNGQSQGTGSISIGSNAGLGQGNTAVAIGIGAAGGAVGQGTNCVAIGNVAGSTGQASSAVAVGNNSGNSSQGADAVAVGKNAGQTSQGASCVAVGPNAGTTNQTSSSVAVGSNAGNSSQGADSVAVGKSAGQTSQGASSVAIGLTAGQTSQGANCVAIGRQAGTTGQSQFSVAVGDSAGMAGQGTNCVALGYRSSYASAQPNSSVSIGASCAVPGAVGRLAFGNSMEAIATTATAGAQTLPANPVGFAKMEWNGVLYKIPLYSN